ncbi:MAG: cyclic nucleotide-binding protein [Enterovirga sp.]|nr:cyclic nucleotide-binding protein [Enterovirga sp.]
MPVRSSIQLSRSRVRLTTRSPMTNPLIARLRLLSSLSEDDLQILEAACTGPQTVPAHSDIQAEGRGTEHIHIVQSGWAARYRLLRDGRRQFPALLIPGDLCDIDALLLNRTHFGVVALTSCTISVLPHARLREIMESRPAIRDVFWWLTFVENAISAEWTVGLGARSAEERLAHLFCELLVRLATVEMTDGNSYALPLTQDQLSDAVGLSAVHLNRTLQDLRGSGLISLDGHRLTIHNWEALKDFSDFSADYLHVEGLRSGENRRAAH